MNEKVLRMGLEKLIRSDNKKTDGKLTGVYLYFCQ